MKIPFDPSIKLRTGCFNLQVNRRTFTAELCRSIRTGWTAATRLLVAALQYAIVGLRPLLGPATCRYEYDLSCTRYACQQLQNKPLPQAIWLICKRIVKCKPSI